MESDQNEIRPKWNQTKMKSDKNGIRQKQNKTKMD